jgi:hypothetical protein
MVRRFTATPDITSLDPRLRKLEHDVRGLEHSVQKSHIQMTVRLLSKHRSTLKNAGSLRIQYALESARTWCNGDGDLTFSETRKILNVTPMHIQRSVDAGYLWASRPIGGRSRISATERVPLQKRTDEYSHSIHKRFALGRSRGRGIRALLAGFAMLALGVSTLHEAEAGEMHGYFDVSRPGNTGGCFV